MRDIDRTRLDDEQWLQILAVLQIDAQVRIGCPDKCREFIESVLGYLEPEHNGDSYQKSVDFGTVSINAIPAAVKGGIWSSVLECFSTAADLEFATIDSSVIRAHACAAGASGSSADNEDLGRSKGGFSCKVHALTDALGLPVKFILTAGQAADITQAIPLVEGVSALSLTCRQGVRYR